MVTYNPDHDIAKRLAAIRSQVGALVVVDNHSSPEILQILNEQAKNLQFDIIANRENVGVAVALNQGAVWGARLGYECILTMDDDTEPESFMAETLLLVYNSLEHPERVAVIGSKYWGRHEQMQTSNVAVGAWTSVKITITSGSLISLAIYKHIGPFKESFFIDHVDTEYCLRARSHGYHIIKALRPTMRHYIGRATDHGLPWGRVQTSNHSPLRRYYNTRNLMILAREFYKLDSRWVLATVYSWSKSVALLCLFEGDRLPKLRSIWAGIRDGLRRPRSAG